MKKPEPMSFKEWLRAGMEHYNKEYGFTFELLTPKLDGDKQARAKQHIENLCKLQIGIRKQIPL